VRLATGVGLAALALPALLAAPVAAVRVEQQVERRQVVATLRAGRVAQLIEVEAPGLMRVDLAVTSLSRPAPPASLRLVEWPSGAERVRVALPRRLPRPGGHEYTSLRFPAIADSAGRVYQAAVERDGPPDGTELRLWGRRGAAAGAPAPGPTAAGRLAYRAWHRTTGWAALRVLRTRVADAPLAAAGAAAGAVAYAVALGALLGRLRADAG
jgi:hypothetical protein